MEEKVKYLELVEGSFNESHFSKQTSQNPYVAYSIQDDQVIYSIIPESPYQMVDLGLPSGLKWADRNVGASSPEDAGLYFQWGDTVGYTAEQVGVDKVFNWNTYKYGTNSNLTKYNSTDNLIVLESIDDAATAHMGLQYRMPTIDEMNELLNNTTLTFIDLDGNAYIKGIDTIKIEQGKLKGVRFTGSNGNSIFIPAAGNYDWSSILGAGACSCLWSSSLYADYGPTYMKNAKCFYLDCSGTIDEKGKERNYGLSVRGVQA